MGRAGRPGGILPIEKAGPALRRSGLVSLPLTTSEAAAQAFFGAGGAGGAGDGVPPFGAVGWQHGAAGAQTFGQQVAGSQVEAWQHVSQQQ
jgi:hypothetical protein